MTENQKAQIMKLRAAGYGYGKIAQELDISLNTVKSFCRRNRLKKATIVPVIPTGEVTHCENCGREIKQVFKRKRRRFCSDKCRNLWWNSHLDLVKRKAPYTFRCQHCGKEFHIYGDRRRKYCSHDCYVADRFKGGDCHD